MRILIEFRVEEKVLLNTKDIKIIRRLKKYLRSILNPLKYFYNTIERRISYTY